MRNGTKNLRIASIIQLILGVLSILLTRFLLKNGDMSTVNVEGGQALMTLLATYAGAIFQILAGVIGLLLSNRKSVLTVVFGVLLFVPQLVTFFHVKNSIGLIILNAVLLAVPYFYLHSAYKNLKG